MIDFSLYLKSYTLFQAVCDADLMVIDCLARFPGSVHDSRILRESGMDDKTTKSRLILNCLCIFSANWNHIFGVNK